MSRYNLLTVCLATVTPNEYTWSMNGTTVAGNPSGYYGSGLRDLYFPAGVYYDRPYKEIIVGDYVNRRALRFSLTNLSANGIVIAGGNGGGCSLNQLGGVWGVALDSLRQLYVADYVCNRIVRFPPNSTSATSGVLIASVNTPKEIFINPLTDDLYVTMDYAFMVIKFSRNSTIRVVVAGMCGFSREFFFLIEVLFSFP